LDLFDITLVGDYIGPLLKGLIITVELTFIVISASLILAIFVALARLSQFRVVRWITTAYVEIIRSTPLLLQLIYIYYVLPNFGITLNPFLAGVVALTINYTAYLSEVYRSGITAISRGQYDAAYSIGMTKGLAMRRIILPQAIRIVIPALGNYFISLFKDTALTAVITVQELLFTGQIIAARSFQYFTVYTIAGFLYFAVGYPATHFVRYLEKISSRGYSYRRKR
jgi:His/Glu/Gln/Arg/opine family amino acid ABC transporter permease subunit